MSATFVDTDVGPRPAEVTARLGRMGEILEEEIRANLNHDDIAACLQYASETLQAEKVYPLTPAGAG